MSDSRAHGRDVFLDEYSSDEAVRRYTARSAGSGISHLQEHDYARAYLEALDQHLRPPASIALRVLEFGCGGGMNVIAIVKLLAREGRALDVAYGTDFSNVLVKAADADRIAGLPAEEGRKLSFHVARNETLRRDLAHSLDVAPDTLLNSFDFIVGVNTFRYCYRLGKAGESAQGIFDLLTVGGVCVMIDMNSRFPAFRSKLRNPFTRVNEETYLPSLSDYAETFQNAGFDVVARKNFCWVPHSAGPALTRLC